MCFNLRHGDRFGLRSASLLLSSSSALLVEAGTAGAAGLTLPALAGRLGPALLCACSVAPPDAAPSLPVLAGRLGPALLAGCVVDPPAADLAGKLGQALLTG